MTSDRPHWVGEFVDSLLGSIPRLGVRWVTVRGQVRVDEPHPRRSEKAGDYIEMADLRMTLAARHIWAGWTPGVVIKVQLADGTVVHSPWIERLVCCDLHGVHCEPPGDLCCEVCSETFHPKHAVVPCVLAEVSP